MQATTVTCIRMMSSPSVTQEHTAWLAMLNRHQKTRPLHTWHMGTPHLRWQTATVPPCPSWGRQSTTDITTSHLDIRSYRSDAVPSGAFFGTIDK